MTVHDALAFSFGRRLASLITLGVASALSTAPAIAQELNALVWCDHADPALLKPFEEANGVKVNVKEFEGTGAGLAIIEQSKPGDWEAEALLRWLRQGMESKRVTVPVVADSLW